jgi:hypothetical protein
MKFFSHIFKNLSPYEYGNLKNTIARRHRRNGNVQFVLFKAGEQGYKEDFWIDYHSDWWPYFKTVDPHREAPDPE